MSSQIIQEIVNAISLGGTYALLALGIAVVFGIMGLINFAYGELIMVAGYTMILYSLGVPWPLMVISVLVVVVALSLAMERLAFRPVRGADPATLLITSFALSYLLQNLGLLVMGGLARPVPLPDWILSSIEIGGVRIAVVNLLAVGLAGGLLTGFVMFMRRTALGIEMRAASEDFEMARLVGVRANAVIATAFAISGLFAAAAAIVFVAQTGLVTPQIGVQPVLIAFVATVMGGLGTLLGSAIGGFLLGALSVALEAGLPLDARPFRDAFIFACVVVVLLVRPQGLIPRLGEARV